MALWHKSWLETRWRAAFNLAMLLLACGLALLQVGMAPEATLARFARRASSSAIMPPAVWWPAYSLIVALILPLLATTLAGAGVNSQTTYGLTQGMHGSMVFTLSLPVSRRQLLVSRTMMGFALTLVLTLVPYLLALVAPLPSPLRPRVADLLPYAGFALVGVLLFFSLSTLLATVLDELWQVMAAMAACGFLFGLSQGYGRETPFTLYPLFSGEVYRMTGEVQWGWLAGCIGTAAVLLVAAFVVNERREY